MDTQITWQITNVLGEARPVCSIWPDGSYSCPWCAYAVHGSDNGVCQNPACWAGRWAHVDWVRDAKAKAEKRAQEEAERKRNHEWAMERIRRENEERNQRRAEFAAKVREAKGCWRCSIEPDRYGSGEGKIKRHRGICPKERKYATA